MRHYSQAGTERQGDHYQDADHDRQCRASPWVRSPPGGNVSLRRAQRSPQRSAWAKVFEGITTATATPSPLAALRTNGTIFTRGTGRAGILRGSIATYLLHGLWKRLELTNKRASHYRLTLCFYWRRGRDSNPRYVAVHLISSQAPSTTRTPLQ